MNHDDRYFEVRALVKDESLRIKDIVKLTRYDRGHVSRLRKASRIDKLIADAVSAEREACAALLDAAVENFTSISLQVNDEDGVVMEHANTCSHLAAAIRARGNHEQRSYGDAN